MGNMYDEYLKAIEGYLNSRFDRPETAYGELLEAMRYSLLAGGKRIRPVLALEFCRISGGSVEEALPVACAIEMLHTYSLIHDDLPCMDDDDLRRGKPTNHKVYGETIAVLAGDALQAEAFGTILRSGLSAEKRAACAETLADAAGVDGICGGQYLDIEAEQRSLYEDELIDIQNRKTGSLMAASCKIGALLGGASPEQVKAAFRYGSLLGSAFQIRDDMLDVIAEESELGKPVGSDKEKGKSTFMALLGRHECENRVIGLTAEAKASLEGLFDEYGFLLRLADHLAARTK